MWQYTATNGTNFYLVCFGLIEIPPHEATPEKPSFLLFGIDCCSPTKAAYLPTTTSPAIPIADYRRELIHSLISAGKLACQCVVEAQKRYKFQYDKHLQPVDFQLRDRVFVHFPQDETGPLCKLSRPWHCPYRVIAVHEPEITLIKVYFSNHSPIQVHQSRVKPCLLVPIGMARDELVQDVRPSGQNS